MKCRIEIFLMLVGIAAALMAVGCGGDDGEGMDDTMMPATGDGELMMPGAGDDEMMPMGLEGGLTRSPVSSVYAGSDADTLGSLLPDGMSVFSVLSASMRLDYGADLAAQPSQDAVYVKSISSDGQGGFHVISVIDGVEIPVHVEADDYDASAFGFVTIPEDGQSLYYLSSWTDAFSEDPGGAADTDRTDGSSEFDYFDLGYWLTYVGSDAAGAGPDGFQGKSDDSFVSYGVRTSPGNLPTGEATYEGRWIAAWWDAEGDPDTNLSDSFIHGALSLEADFDDGTISGRVENVAIPGWSSDSGQEEPVGAISIASSAIGEAQFAADWVGENSDTTAAPDRTLSGFTGSMIGEFYGPAAEEVGGVFSGSRAASGTTLERFMTGGFGASQPYPGQ